MPVLGWRKRLFTELRSSESLAEACRRVEVSRQSVYRQVRLHPHFKARYDMAIADMHIYQERMKEEREVESEFAKTAYLRADLVEFTAALIASNGRVTQACHDCDMVVSTVYRRAKRLPDWQAVLDKHSIKNSRLT